MPIRLYGQTLSARPSNTYSTRPLASPVIVPCQLKSISPARGGRRTRRGSRPRPAPPRGPRRQPARCPSRRRAPPRRRAARAPCRRSQVAEVDAVEQQRHRPGAQGRISASGAAVRAGAGGARRWWSSVSSSGVEAGELLGEERVVDHVGVGEIGGDAPGGRGRGAPRRRTRRSRARARRCSRASAARRRRSAARAADRPRAAAPGRRRRARRRRGALPERLDERALVDDRAPRDVDEERGRLHRARVGARRAGRASPPSAGRRRRPRRPRRAASRGRNVTHALIRHRRALRDEDAHLPRRQQPHDLASDPAVADHAERPAGEPEPLREEAPGPQSPSCSASSRSRRRWRTRARGRRRPRPSAGWCPAG